MMHAPYANGVGRSIASAAIYVVAPEPQSTERYMTPGPAMRENVNPGESLEIKALFAHITRIAHVSRM